MRLHFREYGRGAPLVILHGLFGCLDNWQSISRRLAARFRVFALDQRNHGHSPHSPEMNYDVMAGDLRDFMVARAIAGAHVLGHSMGGKTAMQFALSFPVMTGRLIVVDIAPRAYEPAHGEILEALLSLDPRSFRTRKEAEAALAPTVPGLSERRFLLKNLARDSAGAFHWKLNLQHILANYPALNAAVRGSIAFPGPTLFVQGERSDYIGDRDLPLIHGLFPRAEVRTLPGAGHWVHTDAPEAFTGLVESFLPPFAAGAVC